MLPHHEIDPDARGIGLFTRFRQKDNVAIELEAEALQHQHRDDIGCQNRLVIFASAPPDIAVFQDCAKRIDRPLFPLYTDNIGVSEDEQRKLSIASSDEL